MLSTRLRYSIVLYFPLNFDIVWHLYLIYYQKKSGAEIDFIVEGKTAYEVKTTGGGFDVRRLEKTASKLGITNYSVVTLAKTDKGLQKVIYPYSL